MKPDLLLFSMIICAGSLLTGCNKEDESVNLREFAGYYKIISIQSDTAVDMNNDGIPSNDLLHEISTGHIVNGQRVANYYNPDIFIAEVRPLPEHSNDNRLISFNYPYQTILHEDEEDPLLMCYTREFLTYTYELRSDNTIEITDFNPEYNSRHGIIHSLDRIDSKSFEISMSVRLYDFAKKKWVESDLLVRYLKE